MKEVLLKSMLETPSVSGCEEQIQKVVAAYASPFTDSMETDPVGNLFCRINPENPVQILLVGHVDEIGFRVTQIQNDGMLRVQKAGGVRPRLYVGDAMQILHTCVGTDGESVRKVDGVVCVTDRLLKGTEVSDSDLLIDIGASSREEAEQAVSVGDPVCADTGIHELLNHRISSRALDDKTGAYVVVEALRRAREKGCTNGVIAHTATGEETTGRGAYFASARLKPTCAIAVDVTWASDCPGTDPGETGLVELGKGPVLCYSGMVNTQMNRLLKQIAEEEQIPVQFEVAGGRTFTDGDTVLKTGEGVPMALVSIPLRYMHSSVEVADRRDLENAVRLLCAFVCRLSSGFRYEPFSLE